VYTTSEVIRGLAAAVAELAVQSQACRQVAAGLPEVGHPDARGGNGPSWAIDLVVDPDIADSLNDTHK
jgi:hypothetical protein